MRQEALVVAQEDPEQDAFLESEGPEVAGSSCRPRSSWKQTAAVATVAGLALLVCSAGTWSWRAQHEAQPSSRGSASAYVTRLRKLEEPPVNHGCSAHNEDCLHTKCCHVDGMQCFEKNEFWAVCNATCEPGVHPGEDNKGWTCAVLEPNGAGVAPAPAPAPPPAACSAGNGEDCSKSMCCQEPDLHCFQKNEWFATCKQDCIAQVQAGDDDDKPWSCLILTAGMEPPSTTQNLPSTATQKDHPDPPGVHTPHIDCDGGEAPKIPKFDVYEGPKTPMIKVLSYNLFWWSLMGVRHGNGNSAGLLIKSTNSPLKWDLMGFQECEDGPRFLATTGLQDQMVITQFQPFTKTAAICFAYRREAFELIAQGGELVAEDSNDQYYGKRAVQWQRLLHRESGKNIFFMNHHGPLPVQTGGKCGGAVTGFHILRVIANNAKEGDAVILTGDFNAAPGTDTLKMISERLTDFVAHDIDNIFSNLPVGSLVRNMDIGNGGSDHDARLAVFQLSKVQPAPAAKADDAKPDDAKADDSVKV